MKRKDFPLVLSPNLGCPQIVSLQDDPSFPLIVAVQLDQAGARPGATVFENRFRLIPSVPGEGLETGLAITQAPSEITDWNQLSGFSDLEDTRNLINRELHYQVLGEGTQYWRVTVSMERDHLGDLLRRKGQATLPTLYDLVTQLDGDRSQRVNHHAVQLVQAIEPRNCVFLHLSDAHVEKRNDEMLDEVLKEHNERDAALIRRDYINFNQNFREAIRVANQRADRGEIEFVLLTGDLVDQAFQGWAEETNPDENNFKKFIDIVVGRGREHSTWGNPGLKVALFTSTGNHDWRLHPYDPASLGRAETFGLKPEEAQRFPYRSFEAADHPEDERSRMAEELASGTLKRFNLRAFPWRDQVMVRIARMMGKIESGWIREALSRWIPGAAAMQFWYFFPGFDMSKMTWINVVPAGGAALGWVAQWTAKRFSRWAANLLVDNPLHAEVSALHYYFTHINPYLDYAFSYGQTHFIMMDSGSDVFIGNLLDGKEVRDLKRASFTDNFIGASPDSRAFDSERTHNNWSQIVWLEKVLDATSIGDRDTVFVSLHAPPLNAPNQLYRELGWWERLVYQFNRRFRGRFRIYPRIESWAETRESHPLRKTQHPWIAKEEIDLSFGTVNHYLSQFFYLCLGLRESEHRRGPSVGTHTKVSMVLAGHAHRNIEFSIGLDHDTHKHENQVRVFSDVYSQPPTHLGQEWKSRPLVVQTAACGPTGRNDTGPPYYRRIEVSNSQIQDFRVFDKNGPDDWFQRGSQSC